jgi:SWI/SNF-related matrix-associated actin-dependent regulator of chromatin subfamily A member 5
MTYPAASKDELVSMVQHGADKIMNNSESMMIDEDIDEIIRRGESKTAELNSKYERLDFDALNNFKSEGIQNWEGEDFAGKAKKKMNWIEPSKRERKLNYSIDGYYKEHMNPGQSKKNTGPKLPRGPKQLNL